MAVGQSDGSEPGPDLDEIRRRITKEVRRTSSSTMSAAELDRIVISKSGNDAVVRGVIDETEEASFPIKVEAVRHAPDDFSSCLMVLIVLVGAAMTGGVVGRYGNVSGWTFLVHTLAPVVAALVVIPALMSLRRPVEKNLAGVTPVALFLVALSGGLILVGGSATERERLLIIGSMIVTAVATGVVQVVRSVKRHETYQIDINETRARRRARVELAAMRPQAIRNLEQAYERAGFGPARLAELEDLWDHAHAVAARHGDHYERDKGPIGASWITSILDIPEDQWDRHYEGQD